MSAICPLCKEKPTSSPCLATSVLALEIIFRIVNAGQKWSAFCAITIRRGWHASGEARCVTGEGFSPRTETPHPTRFARHLLPQGRRRKKRSFEILPDGQITSPFPGLRRVKFHFRKIFPLYRNKNPPYIRHPSRPNKGACRDRHGRGAGCGGRGWRC